MNGAELPCGTALRVEPSESKYGPIAVSVADVPKEEPPSKDEPQEEEEDPDLDDFFSSL